ncbi:hypothetical protein ACFDTO_21335 [Microbacteriaceae bacterium 4G12]
MRKFVVSFLYSLLSFIFSYLLIAMFYITKDFDSRVLIDSILLMVIFGIPLVFVGCILGEIFYKYYIIPRNIKFLSALILYLFLAVGLLYAFMFILGGIPVNKEELFNTDMMVPIGFGIISSVTFFIKRNTYKDE